MKELCISVIIPVYNVELYLSKCLDATVNQTYKNLEILLIDDGSTDSSGDICDEYAKKDSRIRVIHQTNQGLSAARNTALDVFTGEYVVFIDSDDLMSLDYCEYLYKGITQANADISCCNFTYIDEEDKETGRKMKYKPAVFEGTKNCMVGYLQGGGIDTMAWAKMYRREIFDHVRYPVGWFYEDIATMYLIIDQCHRVVVLDGYKYFYRRRSHSITTQSYQKKHLDGIRAADARCDFMKEKYPELYPLVEKTIPRRCTVVIERMAQVDKVDDEDIQYIQSIVRKYRIELLKNGVFKRKSTVLMMFISVRALLWRIHKASRLKHSRIFRFLMIQKRRVMSLIKIVKRFIGNVIGFVKRCIENRGVICTIKYARNYASTLGKNEEFSTYDDHITSEGKIVIYTCLFGDYDTLWEPNEYPDNVDFIAFTDREISKDSVWKKRELPDNEEVRNLDLQRKSRYAKLLPHRVLPEYEYSMYVDANIQILGDLSHYIKYIGPVPIAFSWHPLRNCVYKEEIACELLKKDSTEIMRKQLKEYRRQGMPEQFGLTENNFIVRKHNDEKCIELMETWWKEFMRFSCRDQLCLTYSIWKMGYTMKDFGYFAVCNRHNPLLKIMKHNSGRK